MSEKELFDLINKTYSDPEIERDREIRTRLLKLARDLDSGENYKTVCVKLSNYISYYLASHWLCAPKALLNLSQSIECKAKDYRGSTANSVWISGMEERITVESN
ncbi:bacteriocin immunity protein [Companilactobacillus jidongensis]|uniref:bacteriocin immunity protein n=1 Tax=Companilactobacillus jidongensis TaxID=2486006 RepID=UPI0013DE5A94|nr:bacteriocin immunity protein [Companilactobacillus jidongensis]